jgi:hypothetical protein
MCYLATALFTEPLLNVIHPYGLGFQNELFYSGFSTNSTFIVSKFTSFAKSFSLYLISIIKSGEEYSQEVHKRLKRDNSFRI